MEKRDPFALVLQFLTLLALLWIGAGVSNFVGTDYGPVHSDTDNLERIAKTLDSLDTALAGLTRRTEPRGGVTTLPASAGSATDGAKPTPVHADLRQELREIRTLLAVPPEAYRGRVDGGGSYHAVAETVLRKSSAANVRNVFDQLRNGSIEQKHDTRKNLLLMDRSDVLRRFGKPDSISTFEGNGQHWYYRLDEGNSVKVTFGGSYVVRLR